MKSLRFLLSAVALAALTSSVAFAQMQRVAVRGTVVSSTGKSVVVQTASGRVAVALTPKTVFVGATHASMADIKPGAFLGIANAPGKDGAEALEVSVFDEKLRGVGEGDGPWEAPNHAKSAMTNGTVAKPSSAAMTNGTVANESGSGAKTINVTYKGGSKKIVVPANAPIVHVAPGSKKLLAPKASVYVSAVKRDGGLTAGFIVAGEHGTVVPL